MPFLSNDINDALEIVDFHADEGDNVDGCHTLIHICQRWQRIVFTSSHRPCLRILCTERKPVKEVLNGWPALPIIVRQCGNTKSLVEGADNLNIVAALGCRGHQGGHVCKVCLPFVSTRLLEGLVTLMQQPFPTLIHQNVQSNESVRWTRAVASKQAPFEHVTTLERPPTLGPRSALPPSPLPSAASIVSRLSLITFLFQIPPHLASNISTDNTRVAQNRQHNSRAPPRGRRTGSKHDSCSTSPVEPLFGTTALSDRIVAYRFSALFRTFYCFS